VLNEIQKPIVNDSCIVTIINKKIHDDHPLQPPSTPITSDVLSVLRQNIDITLLKPDSLEPAVKLYIRKLVNAAENAFAERSILLDKNLLLFQQNNERAVRVSTKATMVGNARVMKYEDIIKEQEARDKKELKLNGPRDRPRLNREQPTLPKSELKRKPKISEREEAIREIEVAGLKDFCTIIEF